MKKKSKKKIIKILGGILVIAVVQTLPIFFLKPMGYKTMTDDNIEMYYAAGVEKGAEEVFELLQQKSGEIKDKMKMEIEEPIEVYIYETQNQLALREAGFVTLAIAPSWHIGDSHNGNIMMVSPYTKVEGHTYDSILNATLHELVHAINFRINPKMSYFWDNGLATYLANQKPGDSEVTSHSIPTFKQMQTNNGLEFGNMGGYAYSYLYVQYLDQTYGWDKVMDYASGDKSYEEVFGKSELDVYDDWCDYCREKDYTL